MNEVISYMAIAGLKEKKVMNGRKGQTELINRIIDKSCQFYGLEREKMIGKHRYRDLVTCRQMCVYLLKKHTQLSMVAISNLLGSRDHTTGIHSLRRIKDLMITEPNILKEVNAIETLIF